MSNEKRFAAETLQCGVLHQDRTNRSEVPPTTCPFGICEQQTDRWRFERRADVKILGTPRKATHELCLEHVLKEKLWSREVQFRERGRLEETTKGHEKEKTCSKRVARVILAVHLSFAEIQIHPFNPNFPNSGSTRCRHTNYRPICITGTKIACTRQIVFVMGTSTPSYRHTENDDSLPVTNYDVIKHADVTDVITRVGYTCRCSR